MAHCETVSTIRGLTAPIWSNENDDHLSTRLQSRLECFVDDNDLWFVARLISGFSSVTLMSH
jgi:hypothetical protein